MATGSISGTEDNVVLLGTNLVGSGAPVLVSTTLMPRVSISMRMQRAHCTTFSFDESYAAPGDIDSAEPVGG